MFCPWKVQKIRLPKSGGVPGNCCYQDIFKSLPDPPKGQVWVQDILTREWKLSAFLVADAIEDAAIVESKPVQNISTVKSVGKDGSTAVPYIIPMAVPVGPAAENVYRCSYQYHELKPTDTFQGLCIRYGITATELRRANKILGGTDLRLWPKQLVIRGGKAVRKERTREERMVEFVDHFAHRQRIRSLQRKASTRIKESQPLGSSEARAYLEMNDWVVEEAIRDAEEDLGWALQNKQHAPDDRTESNQLIGTDMLSAPASANKGASPGRAAAGVEIEMSPSK